MEPAPASQFDLNKALLIGVASAITVLAIMEMIEWFYGRYAAKRTPEMMGQTSEYLATHDAVTAYLNNLEARINGGG